MWYAKTLAGPANQALIIDEDTGRNVAVAYRSEDMNLIAAAPSLLDACRAVVERWEHGDLAEAARMCAAAIAQSVTD